MVDEMVISVSTTFYPGNPAISSSPDTVISSKDGVLFYLSSQQLAGTGLSLPTALSPLQGFSMSQLTGDPILHGPPTKIPESSMTLSIVFHILYNLPCAPFSPSLEAITIALSFMSEHQVNPSTLIQPGTFMYAYLMSQYAPFQPLKLYALAGGYRIERLAVDVSSHLLGCDLSKITDEMATAMGASYLRRLFFMHQGRLERLKKVLLKPPSFHDDVLPDCESKNRASLKRRWALMITSLVWDAKPDISPFAIQQNLRLSPGVTKCSHCQASWDERLRVAGMEWAAVKFTI